MCVHYNKEHVTKCNICNTDVFSIVFGQQWISVVLLHRQYPFNQINSLMALVILHDFLTIRKMLNITTYHLKVSKH